MSRALLFAFAGLTPFLLATCLTDTFQNRRIKHLESTIASMQNQMATNSECRNWSKSSLFTITTKDGKTFSTEIGFRNDGALIGRIDKEIIQLGGGK